MGKKAKERRDPKPDAVPENNVLAAVGRYALCFRCKRYTGMKILADMATCEDCNTSFLIIEKKYKNGRVSQKIVNGISQ